MTALINDFLSRKIFFKIANLDPRINEKYNDKLRKFECIADMSDNLSELPKTDRELKIG